jgi:hypothetical protein
LLLKQTFESPDRFLDLNLGGQSSDLVDMGTFETVIHDHNIHKEMGIGFTLSTSKTEEKAADVDYCATYKSIAGRPTIQSLKITSDGRTFAVERQKKGGYLIKAPGYSPKLIGKRPEAKRSYQPERSLAFSPDAIVALGALGPEVQDLSLRLRQAIGRIAYLGPLRQQPARSYLWSGRAPGDLGDLGKHGEYAVHALLASDNSPKRQKEGQEGGRQWLVKRVSYWLKRLGVADELVLERQGKSRHYELIIVRGRQRSNIVDVGFGISQVLPMLVLAHFVKPGTTIIAEQPEIHLHPRAQAGLADLMAEVARTRDVQFIVETHSEYLFRHLQTLIAEEKVEAADCRLYFVDREKNGSAKLQELVLTKFGRITDWPKKFFGDVIGETERQTRKMLERLAKEQPLRHD